MIDIARSRIQTSPIRRPNTVHPGNPTRRHPPLAPSPSGETDTSGQRRLFRRQLGTEELPALPGLPAKRQALRDKPRARAAEISKRTGGPTWTVPSKEG